MDVKTAEEGNQPEVAVKPTSESGSVCGYESVERLISAHIPPEKQKVLNLFLQTKFL